MNIEKRVLRLELAVFGEFTEGYNALEPDEIPEEGCKEPVHINMINDINKITNSLDIDAVQQLLIRAEELSS